MGIRCHDNRVWLWSASMIIGSHMPLIDTKLWVRFDYPIFQSLILQEATPICQEELRGEKKETKNCEIAVLLKQQSEVLGECKISEVVSTLRMTFVHLLHNLVHVPCPATRKERLFPFSFHGRCRWYLRLCVQVFWGLICVGRGEVVACSLTEEEEKKSEQCVEKDYSLSCTGPAVFAN